MPDRPDAPSLPPPPGAHPPLASDAHRARVRAAAAARPRDARGHFLKTADPAAVPPGRERGSKNAVSRDAKLLLDAFVEHGLDGAIELYDRLRVKYPGKALATLARFAEYRLPKLARTEQTGPGGGPVVVERRVVEVRRATDADTRSERPPGVGGGVDAGGPHEVGGPRAGHDQVSLEDDSQ